MENFEQIDKLFGPPVPTTIKGKIICNKPLIYFGIGAIIILGLIKFKLIKSKRINYIKDTELLDSQDQN